MKVLKCVETKVFLDSFVCSVPRSVAKAAFFFFSQTAEDPHRDK